jgi:hypothetical protein
MHVVQTACDTACKTPIEGLKEQAHRMRASWMGEGDVVQAVVVQNESEALQVCMQRLCRMCERRL